MSPTPTPRTPVAPVISTPRSSQSIFSPAPTPGSRRVSTSSVMPRWGSSSMRWSAPSRVQVPHGCPLWAPAGAPGDGVPRAGGEARRVGITASVQPVFDALWGGSAGMYFRRLGADRAAGLNLLALLASAGVPLAFGSDAPVTSMNPWEWVRAAAQHQTPGSAISPRAALLPPPAVGGGPAGCGTVSARHPGPRDAGLLRGVGRR